MKILILHSKLDENLRQDQIDTLNEVEYVKKSLIKLWHIVSCLGFDVNLEKNILNINKIQPDFVFNLVEDVLWKWQLVYLATSLLEHLRIPYSGCGNQSMFITTDKILAKKIMEVYDIVTADRFDLTNIDNKNLDINSKYIIKPVNEDASIWIDCDCIISWDKKDDIKNLIINKEKIFWYKFFAEKYIDGREFNLSIMSIDWKIVVLPAAEIIFTEFQNRPRIVDYKAKWDEGSFEYKNTNRSFNILREDQNLIYKLNEITLKCREVFSLTGYARVDFRVDKNQNIFVLEINTNPCISTDSWFFAACQKHGIDYDEMINHIINI